MPDFTTPAETFAACAEPFDAESAAGVDVIFQYILSGSHGGEWYIVVRGQTCTIAEGRCEEKPTATIWMSDENHVKLVNRQLNPLVALATGKLKVRGDTFKVQLIGKFFPLAA